MECFEEQCEHFSKTLGLFYETLSRIIVLILASFFFILQKLLEAFENFIDYLELYLLPRGF